MQQDCPKQSATHTEIIHGTKYSVVSHYVGNKDFKKVICDHAFKQALEENKRS